MYLCYLDESGGCEPPDSSSTATPVMVILGLIIEAASVPALTRDFLALKRKHFPGRYATGLALDHIKVEVKGSEILQMTRSSSRKHRRQAERVRHELVNLVESHGGRIVGRVWVKQAGKGMNPAASYCYAVQDISRHFSKHLESQSSVGILIADGRTHTTNVGVAHSIFTQKWRAGGDPFPALREVPLFARATTMPGCRSPICSLRPWSSPVLRSRTAHDAREILIPLHAITVCGLHSARSCVISSFDMRTRWGDGGAA